MRNILNILFSVFFHFIALAFVFTNPEETVKIEIIMLQFIFIAYQILVMTQKDKMK